MLVESLGGWGLLVLAALLVGLAKTALPGVGILPVVIFAAVLPARLSTGVLLVILIVGDIVAVLMYRASADWRALRRLVPSVAVGLVVGSVFLLFANNEILRRVIGLTLIVLVVVSVAGALRKRARAGDSSDSLSLEGRPPISRTRSWIYGVIGGVTTMVANAAGPVMSLYFVASGFSVSALLGTSAWYYFVINVAKLPFSIGLGLVTPPGLLIDAILVPAVLAGALLGRAIAQRINRTAFEWIIYVVTFFSAIYLLASS